MIPISAALRGAVELIEEAVKIEDNMLAERSDLPPDSLQMNESN